MIAIFAEKIFPMVTIQSTLNAIMFSSEFGRLSLLCPAASTTFSIRIGADEIFSQTYYPDSDGTVIIYDLDKLLENHISSRSAVTFSVDGSDAAIVKVLPCSMAVPESAETFTEDFFLTTATGERDTAADRYEALTMVCARVTEVTALCSYVDDAGDVSEKTVALGTFLDFVRFDVSPRRFADRSLGRLIAYEIRAGKRRARYRVLANPPEADPALIFRNCFGTLETIYLTGARQTTPSYTRSAALIEGEFRNYDIEETMSFKAMTGPLRPGMVPVALDLARSKEVFLLDHDGSTGDRITITDVDVKHTNEDNSIPDFSFTYRRSDRRSALLDVNRPPRLFDDTFDDTYD